MVREESGDGAAAPSLMLPNADVPSGHIWPAEAGREILRRVPLSAAVARGDLVGRHGVAEGSGSSDLLLWRAGGWCLKTSPRRRYADVDRAREALLDLVRRKSRLGPLLPHDTVVVLCAARGGLWLWTVCPWLETLRAGMAAADARGDEPALGGELQAFAHAAVETLRLAAREGTALDLHPSNFATAPQGLSYVDDDILAGHYLPAAAHAVLRRVEEYLHRAAAIEVYLATLETALARVLSAEDVATLDLRRGLEATPARHPAVAAARERLVRALWRCA